MVEFIKHKIKDLGLQREVFEALPYAVVGGAWEASFEAHHDSYTALNHIVPAGQQLKMLFLRVWTQESTGAKFSIVQTNPAEQDLVGAAAAFPVVGSVPPGSPPTATAAVTAVRDYPMLEAAGAEVLRGGLVDPIHVLEGSIDFNVLYTPETPTDDRYGIVWWGVEKVPC